MNTNQGERQAHHPQDHPAERCRMSCSERSRAAFLRSLGPPSPTRLEAPEGRDRACFSCAHTRTWHSAGAQHTSVEWMSSLRTAKGQEGKGAWGMGRRDPRIHWSSMLLSVKRVLEKRAKPSRYSQARRGMYCDRGGNGGRQKGRGVNTCTFTLTSFCTCCSLHLVGPSFFPTSPFKNLLQYQLPLSLPPSFSGVGRGQDAEENKTMGFFSAHPHV